MTFWERIKKIFQSLFYLGNSGFLGLPSKSADFEVIIDAEEVEIQEPVKKVDASSMTLKTRLYLLEQQIGIFKGIFPSQYNYYLSKINELRNRFDESYVDSQQVLTLSVDPDESIYDMTLMENLENQVISFIDNEVKFEIFSRTMQRLIIKLNMLYNVSIWQRKSKAVEQITKQLERAIEKEKSLVRELSSIKIVFTNIHLRDRAVLLVSYCDYLIFKLSMCNSDNDVGGILGNLQSLNEFDYFDYLNSFKAYLIEEIEPIKALIDEIQEKNLQKTFLSEYEQIINILSIIGGKLETNIHSKDFWKKILEFELKVFAFWISQGYSKEGMEIKTTKQIAFQIKEDDVVSLPKLKVMQSVIKCYYRCNDERLFVLSLLLKNISEKTTYKEIFFVLRLFDALEVLKNELGDEVSYISKYEEKYHYTQSDINLKKEQVLIAGNSAQEYIPVFDCEEDKARIEQTLTQLKFDFKFDGNRVLLNSVYFKQLSNIYETSNK